MEELGLGGSVTIRSIPTTDREAMAQTLVWSSLVVLMSEFETHPIAVVEALELGTTGAGRRHVGPARDRVPRLARAVPLDSTPDELAARSSRSCASRATGGDRADDVAGLHADRLLAVYAEVLSLPAASGSRDAAP